MIVSSFVPADPGGPAVPAAPPEGAMSGPAQDERPFLASLLAALSPGSWGGPGTALEQSPVPELDAGESLAPGTGDAPASEPPQRTEGSERGPTVAATPLDPAAIGLLAPCVAAAPAAPAAAAAPAAVAPSAEVDPPAPAAAAEPVLRRAATPRADVLVPAPPPDAAAEELQVQAPAPSNPGDAAMASAYPAGSNRGETAEAAFVAPEAQGERASASDVSAAGDRAPRAQRAEGDAAPDQAESPLGSTPAAEARAHTAAAREGVWGSRPGGGSPPTEAARRVLEVVDRLGNDAAPRRVFVDLPQLGGLRLEVALRGESVHVSVVERGSQGDLVTFEREIAAGLAGRGFELTGFGSRGGSREGDGEWTGDRRQPGTTGSRAHRRRGPASPMLRI